MKIKYTGTPGEDHSSINMYGIDFPRGKWVDVVNTFAKTKLSRHPHFESQPETDVHDATIKREFDVAMGGALQSAEEALVADRVAQEEQAEVNAANEAAADDSRSDDVDSAAAYQRQSEQDAFTLPPGPDHTPESAQEYQLLEVANQVPAAVAPTEEAPRRGRPPKAR